MKTRRRRLNKTPSKAAKAGGRRAERERKCIVTGEVLAPQKMTRFVVDPTGAVTPDLAEKLPGRGAWVKTDRTVIAKAAKSGAFRRAFKSDVAVAPGLADIVENGLKKRALSALGLARRAGLATCGFDQTHDALKTGKMAVLLSASDASEDGAGKLARLADAAQKMGAQKTGAEKTGRPRDEERSGGFFKARAFSSAELSAAFGREGVRHAALGGDAKAAPYVRDVRRFCAFLSAEDDGGATAAGQNSDQ